MCKQCPKKYYKYYIVRDYTEYKSCCDDIQYAHLCITCGKNAGCYYCTFDPDEKHECEL